jgi:hypothetical protein
MLLMISLSHSWTLMCLWPALFATTTSERACHRTQAWGKCAQTVCGGILVEGVGDGFF